MLESERYAYKILPFTMSIPKEQVIDKIERKIDEQSEQIAKVDNTLKEVVDTVKAQSQQIANINDTLAKVVDTQKC